MRIRIVTSSACAEVYEVMGGVRHFMYRQDYVFGLSLEFAIERAHTRYPDLIIEIEFAK
jgi:hypothetical protein